jgi:hypothetical protein
MIITILGKAIEIMSRRYNDMDDKERKKISNELDSLAAPFTSDSFEAIEGDSESRDRWSDYGLCSSCSYLDAARTEFGSTYAVCDIFKKRLKTNDSIKYCTKYSKVGTMSLYDMKEIAVILELDTKKVGFITDENTDND